MVDIDKSNSLDANEVYIAVLLLYLKIGGICKAGIPADRNHLCVWAFVCFGVRGFNNKSAASAASLDYVRFQGCEHEFRQYSLLDEAAQATDFALP